MIINYTSAVGFMFLLPILEYTHVFFGLTNKVGHCPSMTHVVSFYLIVVMTWKQYEQLINISSLSTLVVQVLNTLF